MVLSIIKHHIAKGNGEHHTNKLPKLRKRDVRSRAVRTHCTSQILYVANIT